ncbi:TMEM143 family protein [Aliiglaciecola sp. LCG003]|uniref:TMEM143 family protein n=1 Tax=Aliiglaciecola sp. LCG003 TaxID=3053655 RepID=UPI002572BBBF|nr:TMEM143 family protein [Aliiglaciecola sp. LCG003]WJG11256.1 TMEM143 family protein [Aliiglaciecola sp. LCG003]
MSKERFIPLRKADLIKACVEHGELNEGDKTAFLDLCKILVSTIHFEYHQTLEVLKDNYAPFAPNSDTLSVYRSNTQDLNNQQQVFAQTFAQVLNAANFEKVTEQDLLEALNEESLFKVRLEVEFEDFAEVVFYRRGEYQKTETLSKFWGLRKQIVSFTNYDKVAVYIKFKSAEYFTAKKHKNLNFEPDSTIIKLFQNVPKADLEMLFPNSEIRMRTLDKAIIGGSALVGGTVVLVTKLGASMLLLAGIISYWIGLSDKAVTIGTQELIALCAGAGVLGGFIFKEWSKFKNRKLKFMKALADNLYFKNLDNNAGVFHHLIDAAEEEECKEAILAYYFLLTSHQPISREQLDQHIEQWIATKFNFEMDFEIEDALEKLLRFGMVIKENSLYKAVSLAAAHIQLDKQWDAIFGSVK